MSYSRRFSLFLLMVFLLMPGRSHAEAPPEESALYFYKAKITDVYDADTVTADVDLGFYVWLHEEKFRLYGISAEEVKGENKAIGKKCRDLLASRVLGKNVLIQSIKNPHERDKKKKYGRWLAVIWLDGVNMNEWIVAQKCAVHKKY